MYVNYKWCNLSHIIAKKIRCQDMELCKVSLRPYYVPKEFSHIIAIIVYILPQAGAVVACNIIQENDAGCWVARMQTQHRDAFTVILGDFNHVTLTSHLTGFAVR